jgi:hypothetical protein
MSPVRIRIVSLASGPPTPFDGEYVVEYDPGHDGVDREGRRMNCHLVTTPILEDALALTSAEAFELWRRVDPRHPARLDGRPNRPLTAFTVEIG